MQFRRLGFAASTWFAFASLFIATHSYAGIYMGSPSAGAPAPLQFSTGVMEVPGPTTYPGFAQPPPLLIPQPISQVVTKAPNNPAAYQNQPRPYVTLPPNPPGAILVPVLHPQVYLTPYYVTTGSLRDNVNRMVAQSKWGRVVWNVPNDYRWMGDITIHAASIQEALGQLLDQYPVQAVFYEENHVVDIIPRRQA